MGALAKSLGIKPGSKEFHALKRGDDLYAAKGKKKDKGKSKKINRHPDPVARNYPARDATAAITIRSIFDKGSFIKSAGAAQRQS